MAFALGLSSMAASAAVCSLVVDGGVTPNDACVVGETFIGGSGNENAGTLNADMVFGSDDWEFIAKDNEDDGLGTPDEGDSSAFLVDGDATGGSMTIADFVFDMYATVAVVLKSGGGADPDGWVAYEVSSTDLEYASIFSNRGGFADISHISLYGSGVGVPEVPLPAGGVLLLAGLGAFAAVKRRKAAK